MRVVQVVILAGGKNAFLPRGLHPTYRTRAATAALAVTSRNNIWVVTDGAETNFQNVRAGKNVGASLIQGLAKCKKHEPVMVIGADLPHITGEALQAFIDEARRNDDLKTNRESKSDIFVGYSLMSDCQALGHTSNHAVRINGTADAKLASVHILGPKALSQNSRILGLLKSRKNVPLMAFQLLGIRWLCRMAFHRPLYVAQAEADVKKRTGLVITGVQVPAELAVDDDTKEKPK